MITYVRTLKIHRSERGETDVPLRVKKEDTGSVEISVKVSESPRDRSLSVQLLLTERPVVPSVDIGNVACV